MFDELLVHNTIALWTDGLLDPCQKHRDDDDRLETLSETDEEDCDLVSAGLGVACDEACDLADLGLQTHRSP